MPDRFIGMDKHTKGYTKEYSLKPKFVDWNALLCLIRLETYRQEVLENLDSILFWYVMPNRSPLLPPPPTDRKTNQRAI